MRVEPPAIDTCQGCRTRQLCVFVENGDGALSTGVEPMCLRCLTWAFEPPQSAVERSCELCGMSLDDGFARARCTDKGPDMEFRVTLGLMRDVMGERK